MPEVTPEELLEHASWMRGLAVRLVGDASSADDLVQSTWLAALRRPPRGDRPVRPWLRTVLRNLVRQRHREETRRRTREREAGRFGAPLPSPETLAGRLETQRLLARLVAGLDEPYRSTVLLRFYEGQTSAEIARRLGIPAGTVRWRLKRAIDELRGRLDREHEGGRRAWLAGLLPLTTELEAVAAPAAPAPAASTVVLVAVLLLIFAGGGVWLSGALSVETPSRDEVARRTGRDDDRDRSPTTEDGPDAPRGGSGTPRSGTPGRGRLQCALRVVDGDGRPIAGARVQAGSLWRRTDVARSDTAGAVAFRISGKHLKLMISAPGHASRFLSPTLQVDRPTHLGDVVLGPGAAVSGRIVDTSGRPIEGACVLAAAAGEAGAMLEARRVISGPGNSDSLASAGTGPDGTFTIDGVEPGYRRIWANARGRVWAYSDPVALIPGETVRDVELTLLADEEAPRIEGVVLAPDGTPATGVEVRAEFSVPGLGGAGLDVVGEDGRFRIVITGTEKARVRVLDRRKRWTEPPPQEVRVGQYDIVIRLEEPRVLMLRVTDPEGEPITRFTVHLDHADNGSRLCWGSLRRHEDGIAKVRAPLQPFRIAVSAPGCLEKKLGPFVAAAVSEDLELTLTPLPGIRGRVLAAGKPVAQAWVRAYFPHGSDQVCYRGPFRVRMSNNVVAETRSSVDGRFSIAPKTGKRIVLRVEADGFAPMELGPLEYDSRLGGEGLEARLGVGGAIEGRVIVDGGRSPAGTIVGISRGDNHPRSVRVGPDGRFRFETLTPGPWVVERIDEEVHAGRGGYRSNRSDDPPPLPVSCHVREGETTRYDLDLRGFESIVLVGRLTTNGGPPGIYRAALGRDGDRGPPVGVQLDTEGLFRLDAPEPGRYRLHVSTRNAGGGLALISDVVDLVGGETRWSLDVTTGTLAGKASPAVRNPSLYHLWRGPGALRVRTGIRTDESGAFLLAAVPAGSGWIVRYESGRWNDPDSWPKLRSVEVPVGGRLDIDLR